MSLVAHIGVSQKIVVMFYSLIKKIFISLIGHPDDLKNDYDEHVLTYSPVFKWGSMGGLAFFAIAFPLLVYFNPPKNEDDLIIIPIILSILFIFAVCSYIEFFTVKIVLSKQGLSGRSGWRGKRDYLWSEIEQITFSSKLGWFIISSEGKVPFRMSSLVRGFYLFPDYCIKNLPEEVYAKAFEDYEEYSKKKQNRR